MSSIPQNHFTKKRQSDLHFVVQETADPFSSLFCFSSSNSRRTSSPYLSIIRTRKSMHRSNSKNRTTFQRIWISLHSHDTIKKVKKRDSRDHPDGLRMSALLTRE